MRQEKLLWLAIVFSTFIYAVIAYSTNPTPPGTFDESARQPLTLALYGLAVVTFVAALAAPAYMRAPARTKMIVSLALFEACAMYGLLAAMLSRDWRVFVPAWLVALLGFWRAYPSFDVSETPADRARV